MKSKKKGEIWVYIYIYGCRSFHIYKKKVQDEIDAWLPTTTTRAKIWVLLLLLQVRHNRLRFFLSLYPPFLISFFCDENIVEKRRKSLTLCLHIRDGIRELYGILLQEHNRISAQSIECILPISASFVSPFFIVKRREKSLM